MFISIFAVSYVMHLSFKYMDKWWAFPSCYSIIIGVILPLTMAGACGVFLLAGVFL